MSRSPDDVTARDLRYTVEVVLASALAQEERRTLSRTLHDSDPVSAARRPQQGATQGASITPKRAADAVCFEFRLLAASARPDPVWPDDGWSDVRHLLAARVESARDALQLSLQAEGFAALQMVAGHAALLRSDDGTIDQQFRFDQRGRGLVVLRDAPDVRRALGHFIVRLLA